MAESIVSSSRPEQIVGKALVVGSLVALAKFAWNTMAREQDVWDSVGDSFLAGSTAAAGSVVGSVIHDEMLAAGYDESAAKLAGAGTGITTKLGLRLVIDQTGKAMSESQATMGEVLPQAS